VRKTALFIIGIIGVLVLLAISWPVQIPTPDVKTNSTDTLFQLRKLSQLNLKRTYIESESFEYYLWTYRLQSHLSMATLNLGACKGVLSVNYKLVRWIDEHRFIVRAALNQRGLERTGYVPKAELPRDLVVDTKNPTVPCIEKWAAVPYH
jgi:hypothetical protein